ncbi:MAG: hypothetical protein ACFB0C_10765 [Leptolyngbyaceae cyanobacterium]
MKRKLRLGDRVQFSAEVLKVCDSVIDLASERGTITAVRRTGSLEVQFEGSKEPCVYPADYLELSPQEEPPGTSTEALPQSA